MEWTYFLNINIKVSWKCKTFMINMAPCQVIYSKTRRSGEKWIIFAEWILTVTAA